MKKAVIISIIALCPTCFIFGQIPVNNDLAKLNISGKVKVIKQRLYEAISENGTFRKGKAGTGDSNDIDNNDTEFDSIGNIKAVLHLRFIDGSLVETDKYRYENEKLQEIVTFNAKGDPYRKRSFTYDPKGNKIKETFLIRIDAKPLVTTFSYTKNGQIEKIVDYSGSNTEFKYDEKGIIIEKKEKTDDIGWLTKFYYNDDGSLSRTEKYRNKKVFEMVNYKYDSNGKQILPKSIYVLEELDKQGNWIKKVKSSHGSYYFMERTIEYNN